VIVHQDIQLSQFLFNNDLTRVKLNDFNRAEFVLWDEANNEYCKYTEGKGHGDWRSPEEFVDGLLNEKVDVFSLGNNFYSILTGLWVFYDSKDTKETQARVKKGELPFIDPRYKEIDSPEAALAEVIEWCLTFDPEKRPSIFDVVAKLNKALMKYVQDFSSQNVRVNTAALI
jgi:serine/threonine protein kinase